MDNTQIQQGQQWLEELLTLAGLPSTVNVKQEEDSCWLILDEFSFTPEQIVMLTGLEGEVLDSLQYLTNTIVNLGREDEEKISYTVELNGYQLRRQMKLRAIADQAINRVRQTGVEVEIKSLSSVERRFIHNLLQGSQDIETYSRGQDPDRRLVIKVKT